MSLSNMSLSKYIATGVTVGFAFALYRWVVKRNEEKKKLQLRDDLKESDGGFWSLVGNTPLIKISR